MIKHITVSTLLWSWSAGGWRLGLIEHPLLGLLLPPGGHVEPDENLQEAAEREVTEETGLEVDLIAAPGVPLHESLACPTADPPWWICEHPIPADNHLDEPHTHVDHKYVGIARSREPVSPPAHPFAWYAPDDLTAAGVPDDVRQLAAAALLRLSESHTVIAE